MGKKILFMVLVVGFIAWTTGALAHPPSEIMISHDPEAEELMIEVTHSSGNPDDHYIERVEISINGDLAIVEVPAVENDPMLTVDVFDLELEDGDLVSVKAFCSRAGDLAREIMIER